ncbi:RNA-binding protein involved in heterochromatin assembly dri1 [Linum grandiflorum]
MSCKQLHSISQISAPFLDAHFAYYINPPPHFHIISIFLNTSLKQTFQISAMNRPGDWSCRACAHLNFQRRDSCQRCGDPKPATGGGGGDFFYGGFGGGRGVGVGGGGGGMTSAASFGFAGPDVRPGDWYCTVGNCGAHNFASRSSCFKCAASKDESGGGGGAADMSRMRGAFPFGGGGGVGGSSRAGWKSGDWICTRAGCNEHNFASRMECYRCNAPRDLSASGGNMSAY